MHPAVGGRTIGFWDLGIVVLYLLGVVALGFFAGTLRRRQAGEGSRYFLAGNTLTWPVIGLAMFAANISTVHLVSLAEAAYKYGLVFGNFEWMAGFTLIALSLFFAPLYLRSKVSTLPDYLERRYNRPCRDILTFVSLLSAILLHIGVALYTAALVLCGIVGLEVHDTIWGVNALLFFIVALGLLTGLYTMYGGLLAVVWTESVQTVILLLGSICITGVGFVKLGGWSALTTALATQPHPLFGSAPDIPATTVRFLSMGRQAGDPGGLTWYSVLLGYPVIGIWYWCCDQTIVQRVLAARDEHQARLGPLFCAVLKIFPVFFFVLPGVICVALVQNKLLAGAAPHTAADTYTFLITHLLPVGIKGLVIAAMLSAAMQTCSAALNSTATLFAYDIFRRLRPNSPDTLLVRVGRITTVVATVVAMVISPLFGHYDTIFTGLNKLITAVAPPITAVFLAGVFWRKASGRAALLTLIVGGVAGAVFFVLDWNGWYQGDFMLTAFGIFAFCLALMIAGSCALPETLKAEAEALVWTSWRAPLGGARTGRWLTDYRTLSLLITMVFVLLYWHFW